MSRANAAGPARRGPPAQEPFEVGLEGAVVAQAGQGVALGSQRPRRVERLRRLQGS